MKPVYSVFCGMLCGLLLGVANAAEAEKPVIRASVFSTSADWQAVTGIRFSEYRLKFDSINSKKLIEPNGLELYFLDSFPCFGQPDRTRIWIGANGKINGEIRLTCLYIPEKVNFAWRNAKQDDRQGATKGILECRTGTDGDFKIDLSKCTQGKDWKELK